MNTGHSIVVFLVISIMLNFTSNIVAQQSSRRYDSSLPGGGDSPTMECHTGAIIAAGRLTHYRHWRQAQLIIGLAGDPGTYIIEHTQPATNAQTNINLNKDPDKPAQLIDLNHVKAGDVIWIHGTVDDSVTATGNREKSIPEIFSIRNWGTGGNKIFGDDINIATISDHLDKDMFNRKGENRGNRFSNAEIEVRRWKNDGKTDSDNKPILTDGIGIFVDYFTSQYGEGQLRDKNNIEMSGIRLTREAQTALKNAQIAHINEIVGIGENIKKIRQDTINNTYVNYVTNHSNLTKDQRSKLWDYLWSHPDVYTATNKNIDEFLKNHSEEPATGSGSGTIGASGTGTGTPLLNSGPQGQSRPSTSGTPLRGNSSTPEQGGQQKNLKPSEFEKPPEFEEPPEFMKPPELEKPPTMTLPW